MFTLQLLVYDCDDVLGSSQLVTWGRCQAVTDLSVSVLQVLFSRYCPLFDTGLTIGMRLLYTSVTWCYGKLHCMLGSAAAAVAGSSCSVFFTDASPVCS